MQRIAKKTRLSFFAILRAYSAALCGYLSFLHLLPQHLNKMLFVRIAQRAGEVFGQLDFTEVGITFYMSHVNHVRVVNAKDLMIENILVVLRHVTNQLFQIERLNSNRLLQIETLYIC